MMDGNYSIKRSGGIIPPNWAKLYECKSISGQIHPARIFSAANDKDGTTIHIVI
jgi:hypothetical protein